MRINEIRIYERRVGPTLVHAPGAESNRGPILTDGLDDSIDDLEGKSSSIFN
jgi:hypothetical protein